MHISPRESVGILVGLILVAGGLLTGCGNTSPGAQPPEIPPVSTMQMDFSDFQAGATGKIVGNDRGLQAQVGSRSNWGWAALQVLFWNTVVAINGAVPVGAFVESFNHAPTRLEDGTWVWAYDTNVLGEIYSSELQAVAVGGDIQWNMFISKAGEYADVNWFSGVSDLLGTGGSWTLNMDPLDPKPFVQIEWHRNPADGTSDIKYTNIIPDDAGNGGYIFFAITDAVPLDATYDIFNMAEDNLAKIEWSRATKAGHIRDPLRYDDDDWHCWNEALVDVDCSTAGF